MDGICKEGNYPIDSEIISAVKHNKINQVCVAGILCCDFCTIVRF